jgi:cytochrome c
VSDHPCGKEADVTGNLQGAARRRVRIGRYGRAMLAAPLALLALAHSSPVVAAGDAGRGAKVYQDCMLCHSLDKNEIGPRHRDVFGRKAGAVADYDYSAALKSANIVWNDATLDRWLSDPQAFVPGTKMAFSVDDAQDRADVIAFLKEKAAGGK